MEGTTRAEAWRTGVCLSWEDSGEGGGMAGGYGRRAGQGVTGAEGQAWIWSCRHCGVGAGSEGCVSVGGSRHGSLEYELHGGAEKTPVHRLLQWSRQRRVKPVQNGQRGS